MKSINDIKAYKFDWNAMTVEAFDEKKAEAIMIFNFDITTETKIQNVIQYVVGRTSWACKNLPAGAGIRMKFDIRGQDIAVSRSALLKNSIVALLNKLNLNNQIFIEFYR